MATLKFDLEAAMKAVGLTPPKIDYTKPYQVGEREYHKSPGSRTWTEVWVHPRPATRSEDGLWENQFDDRVVHQGADFINWVEFWEEVEMTTGENATVEELRGQMHHLDREQVEAGYRHYYDKWTWEDDSERTRRLMLAFEAEHEAPTGTRIYEKAKSFIDNTILYSKIEKEINQFLYDESKLKPPSSRSTRPEPPSSPVNT